MKCSIKLASLVLALVMLFSSLTISAYAETMTYENFKYEVSDSKVTITGYDGKAENIVIPAEINSMPVTAVKKEAFKENKTVKSVEIPDSVESIGNKAFALCEKLETVKFGENVKSIGLSAFYGTPIYTRSTMSDGGTYINNCLIHVAKKNSDSKKITSYKVKDGTRLIAQGAFYLDSLTYTSADELVYADLKTISIPSSVKIVNAFAFYGCSKLTQLNISDGVENIDGNAFEKCSSLKSISLPKALKKLNKNVFNSCDSLTTVTVCGNPELSQGAFNACKVLTSVEFAEGLKSFDLSVFNDCAKLATVTLPASLTKFTDGVAKGCDALKTIKSYKGSASEIFAKEKEMEFVSLGNCPFVLDYDVDENNEISITKSFGAVPDVLEIPSEYDGKRVSKIEKEAFKDNENVTAVFVPDGIEIADDAFSSMKKLETVVFGKEDIVGNSFNGCKALKNVVIEEDVASISNFCFDKNNNISIYGYPESFAEAFAKDNNYGFKDITSEPAPACYQNMLTEASEKLKTVDTEKLTAETIEKINSQIEVVDALKDSGKATVSDVKKAVADTQEVLGNLVFIIIVGDTNRDGKVSIIDAKWVLQNVADMRELKADQVESADINKDGKISVVDAKWILQIIAQIRDSQGTLLVTTTKTTTTTVKTTTTTKKTTTTTTKKAQEVKYDSYLLKVNRTQNIVTVYVKDNKGKYTVPIKAMVCSVGLNGKTPTGTFTTSDKYTWRLLSGDVYGQYATRITGHILFHSVPYFTQNKGDLEYKEYNKLGQAASLGCVRLCVRDAKWIYDNCKSGTTVVIYDSLADEPISPPAPIKIDVKDSRRGWDPTDPDTANPWKK